METWECHDCAGEREFVQPECTDGHGFDCPEWACLECGAAVLVGPVPLGAFGKESVGSVLAIARRELRGAA